MPGVRRIVVDMANTLYPVTMSDRSGRVTLTRLSDTEFEVTRDYGLGLTTTPMSVESPTAGNALWLWWVTK